MDRDGIRIEEISYTGLALDIFHNFWLILLMAAAIWLGATGIGNLTYVPQYTAEATLAVTVKGGSGSYANLSTASAMANVFGEVFQSDSLKKLIQDDMGEKTDAVILSRQIPETNLLHLKVSTADPRQSYLFIRAALKHYEEVSGYVFANAALEVVQEPLVPSEPSNVSRFIDRRPELTLLGFLGMTAVITAFYLLRFTVKNAASAKNQLDGDILGVIPYERKETNLRGKQSKKALRLDSPIVSMRFAEATRRMEAAVERKMRKEGQKVLLVTSISENEGKSTVAANIAVALAEKHHKVLLVDGDLKKPAMYKIFEEKSAARKSFDQVLTEEVSWRDAACYNQDTSLWEIFQMRGMQETSRLLDVSVLENLIGEWREEMDYIIIDCSPTAVAADAEVWMQLADTTLLVVRQDWSDVRVINDTVDLIWQSGCEFSGFVLNAFRQEWGTERQEYTRGDYSWTEGK